MAPFGRGDVKQQKATPTTTFYPAKTRPVNHSSQSKRVPTSPVKSQARPSVARTPKTAYARDLENEKKEQPSHQDDQAMMDSLLAGLDASVFDDWGENSQPSPKKPRLPQGSSFCSPRKEKRPRPSNVRIEPVPPTKRAKALSPRKVVVEQKPSVGTGPRGSLGETVAQIVSRKSAFAPTVVKREAPTSPIRAERTPEVKVEVDIPQSHKPVNAVKSPKQVEKVKPEIEDEDMFEFEFGLEDLDFDEQELLARPPPVKYPVAHPNVPPAPPGYEPTEWIRCTVDACLEGHLFEDGIIPSPAEVERLPLADDCAAKTLIVSIARGKGKRVVHLKDRWADTLVKKDDIVNIVSPCLSTPSTTPIAITFRDPSTFLIHHPDLMLTMTSIANAMPCPRKPILQTLIKTPAPPTKPLLYGTVLHQLLQDALLEQEFGAVETFRRLDKELKKEERRLEVWGTGMGIQDVREEVGQKAGRGFEIFKENWVGPEPRAQGELHSSAGDQPSLLALTGLHEVEEDIWCPKWGLKGKVDASVQVKIAKEPSKGSEAEENVAPLEIKTGRSVGVMAHRAQTMLYTLLMEDRYRVPVTAGLLYYSQSDTILRVEAKPMEIRALIMARNELAFWLSKQRKVPKHISEEDQPVEILRGGVVKKEIKAGQKVVVEEAEMEEAFLPATIDNPRECKMCYANEACMLYRRVNDQMPYEDDDPIAEQYRDMTSHMTDKHAQFYKKWDTLLTVEEQDTIRFRSHLWTMTAKRREKNGRCFSDMIIQSYSNDIGKSLAKIHRHSYTFTRAPSTDPSSDEPVSLLSGHIAKGDPVSLSIEPDLLCMWRGFVTDLTQTSVTVAVTYVIDTQALLKRTGREHRVLKADNGEGEDKVMFRIDKDEMSSGMMRMRNNLAQLFYKNGDEQRRRLIVDQEAPEFEPSWGPTPEEIPASLNTDQQQAMESVLTARDYSLILGMPGTGKTTTITEIIKALVARGKSVLLTSYTHSAVDTILMKLVNAEFGVLRLGNIDKVHPDVQHMTLEAYESSASMDQLDARLMKPPVVAATCLAIDHPLFFRRKFDYCIVDEASQITLPTCIGPLRMADKFVLVGDHYQLPPIVRHPEARRGGLDVSLFRHLSSAHPQAVVDLSYQYRMNEDIMALSNKLVYEGRLKCGNEVIAQSGLKLRNRKTCKEIYGADKCSCIDGDCWVQELLDESAKCVFMDTDGLPTLDSRVGDLIQNEVEAELVSQFSTALVASGIRQEDLAVITPYRQQIKLLSSYLTPLPRVEILTADKSQGRDKDCILVSLVRSNDTGAIGDLLRDWRRINVSFTRAKKKLVIIGSARTLGLDPLFGEFMELVRGKGWEKRLKKGDDKLHVVDVPGLRQKKNSGTLKKEVKKEKGARETQKEKRVLGAGKAILNGKGPFAKEIMVGSSP
ncbi:DNA replication ATP-dependent helicase Dna2 [Cryptococcus wingfieldii CBS 7118]|uniref:DNA replication ATP-dependent helicase/nuclease DNA2 n=1 Tax=Cryptococcus wingfieldii CBS 7118 TaxID=1295528 RepID=A0A1E3IVQ4_9TREE|nr:DNA replication ATP-dependent helicase Dna2 [Cryptococcus wingfieldii CBS 7118]ODN92700.1 DNA replication ATP-dependent helicase Dna2 [Cryptococcus wingfieldii CBS 7118]